MYAYTYLFIGAWYAYPNAEDLALSAKPLHFGALHSIKHTLLTYDGRYFTNILHTINPLALGKIEAYKWQTILTIILLPLSLSYFIKNLLTAITYSKALIFSLLFCLMNYALSPSLPHQIYWMVSSFVYSYCWILWFLWVGLFLNYIHTKKYFSFVLALILLICSNGINEMFLVINGATVIMFFSINFIKKHFKHPSIALLLTYVFSTLFFISNPGILIRFNSFKEDRIQASETNIIVKSCIDFFSETGHWFTQEIIFISFLVFTMFFLKNELKNWSQNIKISQVYFFSLLLLIAIYLSSYAFYIPMGFEDTIPFRIYTSIDLGVQLILGISIPVILIKHFEGFVFKFTTPWVGSLSILSILIALMFGNNNISVLKKEFRNNTLLEYSETINLRYETIKKSKSDNQKCWKVATIEKVKNLPKSIYSPPDILSNKEAYYWNNAYEKYFEIDEVRLVGDTVFDYNLIEEINE